MLKIIKLANCGVEMWTCIVMTATSLPIALYCSDKNNSLRGTGKDVPVRSNCVRKEELGLWAYLPLTPLPSVTISHSSSPSLLGQFPWPSEQRQVMSPWWSQGALHNPLHIKLQVVLPHNSVIWLLHARTLWPHWPGSRANSKTY